MCTHSPSDSAVLVPDWAVFGKFPGVPVFPGSGSRFESHLGHSVSIGQGRAGLSDVDKRRARPGVDVIRPERGSEFTGLLTLFWGAR